MVYDRHQKEKRRIINKQIKKILWLSTAATNKHKKIKYKKSYGGGPATAIRKHKKKDKRKKHSYSGDLSDRH